MISHVVFLSILLASMVDAKDMVYTLCVSGSNLSSQVDGTYEYLDWNSKENTSIYYNLESNKYLYTIPSIQQFKQYIISTNLDNTSSTATSMCLLNASLGLEYYKQCFNGWISYINNESFMDSDLRLFDCTDICVTHRAGSGVFLLKVYRWHIQMAQFRLNDKHVRLSLSAMLEQSKWICLLGFNRGVITGKYQIRWVPMQCLRAIFMRSL
eukprot:112945_1